MDELKKLFAFNESIDVNLQQIDFSAKSKKNDLLIPYFYEDDKKDVSLYYNKKQPDIAYVRGLLLASGAITQENGYYFKRDLLIKNYLSLLHKPINVAHQSDVIVGHIYDVALIKRPPDAVSQNGIITRAVYDYKDYLIPLEDIDVEKGVIQNYDGDIDVWIGFMFYRKYFSSLFDYIQRSVTDNSTGVPEYYKLALSMEVWYNKYGFLFDLDENTIVEKTNDNMYLDDYVGRVYKGRKVYKIYLDDYTFAASALTDYPAELRSFLKDAADKNKKIGDYDSIELYNDNSAINYLLDTEIRLNNNDFDYSKNFNIDESSIFLLDDDELSVIKELDNDLYLTVWDIAGKVKKSDKKKKKPKKYADVPTNQFADPKNYKYPLNTEKRVRAAIVYFSRYGGRYSKEEQKTIWKKIIRAANKFGIKVSDKIKKLAKSSKVDLLSDINDIDISNIMKEVHMDELKKFFNSIQERLDTLVSSKNNNPDISSVVSELKNMFTDKEMKLVSDEISKKDEMIKDLSSKIDAFKSEKDNSEKELKNTLAEKDTKIAELEKASKEKDEKIASLEKDLSTYKMKEQTIQRLDEVKKLGIPLSSEKIDELTEKASKMSDDAWKSFMDAFKVIDVSSLKKDVDKKSDSAEKRDVASTLNDVTMKDLGRIMLSDSDTEKMPENRDLSTSSLGNVDRRKLLASIYSLKSK